MDTDATTNAAQPKPRRRWYQFTLRTLLVVVTLAGCGFAWLGIKVRNARQQQAEVAAVARAGGSVIYDYQFVVPGNAIAGVTPPGPVWLHRLLGDDCFQTVVEVNLSNQFFDDDDLAQIGNLPSLKVLRLDGTMVTDDGLEHLQGLTKLEELWLDRTQVTDVGLRHLQGLARLKRIQFGSAQ